MSGRIEAFDEIIGRSVFVASIEASGVAGQAGRKMARTMIESRPRLTTQTVDKLFEERVRLYAQLFCNLVDTAMLQGKQRVEG
jgi:hypothetical protein